MIWELWSDFFNGKDNVIIALMPNEGKCQQHTGVISIYNWMLNFARQIEFSEMTVPFTNEMIFESSTLN